MPDIPVAGRDGAPYDSAMEERVARLGEDVHEVKSDLKELRVTTGRLEVSLVRIETILTTTLPYLATKADLAEKPSKTYMWGVLAVLLTAYGLGLAGLAILK
jgi:hypothetical protein